MSTWLIEPRDTVVLRNGRSIGEGGMMRSLWFPWPSTIAGLLRYRAGTDAGTGRFGLTPEAAKRIPVAGPWLARLDAQGAITEWFMPAPLDCVWQRAHGGPWRRTPLTPRPPIAGHLCDAGVKGLELVGPLRPLTQDKPAADAPVFWSWTDLSAWLANPAACPKSFHNRPGLDALKREFRTHVTIAPATQTAEEGMLYGAEHLRFTRRGSVSIDRYAIVVRCDEASLQTRSGVALLGGERRVSSFRAAARTLDMAPPPIVGTLGSRLRVVLVTPAIFAEGAVPREIAGAKVVAACVGRPEVISGWDMARDDRNGKRVERGEKPTRRMAPAGSVYWVEVEGDARRWAERAWLTCVSSDEQDRLDGFGLCVVGGA